MSSPSKSLPEVQKELDELKERVRKLERNWEPIGPLPVPNPGLLETIGCSVCGMRAATMGYVCPHPRCPSRITC